MLGGSRGGEGDASAGSDNIWGEAGVYLGYLGVYLGKYLGGNQGYIWDGDEGGQMGMEKIRLPLLIIKISGGTLDKFARRSLLDRSDVLGITSSFSLPVISKERNPLRPAKKGVLAMLSAIGHGRGEEFDIEEVVASQCTLHLFYHTSAIFQKGQ